MSDQPKKWLRSSLAVWEPEYDPLNPSCDPNYPRLDPVATFRVQYPHILDHIFDYLRDMTVEKEVSRRSRTLYPLLANIQGIRAKYAKSKFKVNREW